MAKDTSASPSRELQKFPPVISDERKCRFINRLLFPKAGARLRLAGRAGSNLTRSEQRLGAPRETTAVYRAIVSQSLSRQLVAERVGHVSAYSRNPPVCAIGKRCCSRRRPVRQRGPQRSVAARRSGCTVVAPWSLPGEMIARGRH